MVPAYSSEVIIYLVATSFLPANASEVSIYLVATIYASEVSV